MHSSNSESTIKKLHKGKMEMTVQHGKYINKTGISHMTT